ncbi:MAG: histidine--tRNA ligase [Candidatus Magasanikbacteria bacterium CG10_big_fil_rev_8_21_14_0_10_36_32]|uniref:Histidine--tRNA ligase n=1 Tax=Candidatus Magasanikbacteria bacterium CG10_big_fil_rev_8_21_14_0_10_36_32 TaxID=1974646 RepID=A0A2M6W5H3_9BACT|nr:MAG: histidine--tRNA ligase [Candidatus Magasanikbacteria bacterium CG10_big_fil_rev_8_21_14_0_10_36_32]
MPNKKKEKIKSKNFSAKKTKEQPKKKNSESAGALVSEKSKKSWNVLRGMHDILPREEKYWKVLYHTAEDLAETFQFGRIDTPILEEANMFIRSIGKGTDIVDKEMYIFDDQDGTKICLRPEATPSVARAFIVNGMLNYPQPVKMWYWGPMFRHDRPQAGRYRQFHQVGFETIGVMEPAVDAELILLAYNFYKDLGIPVEIHVNSIGLLEERDRFKTELTNYYRTKRSCLCEDCRHRLTKNPLRLLDCKEDQCQPIKDEAPQIIDWLSENSKNYFMKVLEYLDELEIPYILRPTLVRGLDYYTHTVFEVYPAAVSIENECEQENSQNSSGNQNAQSALGGGGRYDLLIEDMGGRPTSAAGFALGVDRAVILMKQMAETGQIKIPRREYDVFFAQLGDRAKARAFRMIDTLRHTGISIGFNFYKNSLKSQLELANDLKVPYTLILGQKEVQEGTIIIRDMESGIQEIVDQKKLESAIKRKLKKFDVSVK